MLKQRKELKSKWDTQKVETENCVKITDDVRKYNEKMLQTVIENRKGLKKEKGSLIISEMPIVTVM